MSTFLFASDLHGNREAYDALFALEADAIVLGGDLLPHPRGKGDELLDLQRRFAESFLAPLLRRRAAFWIAGNDDWAAAIDALAGCGTCLHDRAVPFLDGFRIAGYPCVPVTPFGMKDFDRFDGPGWQPRSVPKRCVVSDAEGLREVDLEDVRRKGTVERDLQRLAGRSDPTRTIYVTHSPPYDSGLDTLHGGEPVGSRAVRAFIEARRPPVTLHGHIHESPGVVTLGETVSANPGDSVHALRALRVELPSRAVTPIR